MNALVYMFYSDSLASVYNNVDCHCIDSMTFH